MPCLSSTSLSTNKFLSHPLHIFIHKITFHTPVNHPYSSALKVHPLFARLWFSVHKRWMTLMCHRCNVFHPCLEDRANPNLLPRYLDFFIHHARPTTILAPTSFILISSKARVWMILSFGVVSGWKSRLISSSASIQSWKHSSARPWWKGFCSSTPTKGVVVKNPIL